MRRALVGLLLVGVAFALLPQFRLPAFHETFLYLVFHWVALATSWNLLSGYSGYFSFGHAAFFGVGMYTTATLTVRFGLPFLWTLPAAAALAALLGVALGAVAFRVRSVRGELFALLTLAATFVVATLIINSPIDGGQGVYLSGVAVPALGATPSTSFYLLALIIAVITVAAALAVYHSRLGVGLFAIHCDEDVAEVLGVPTYRFKLLAFALSCALAGAVGGVHALFVSYVTTNEVFTVTMPLTVVLMSVLGGTRHWAGPAVGAAVITALLFAFTAGDSAVVGKVLTGLVLIAVVLFFPRGLLGWLLARRSRSRAAAPENSIAAEAALEKPVGAAAADAAGAAETIGTPARDDRLLLRATGLVKQFHGIRALSGVDVDIHRGEILGLVGPNGSGKSTFINVVSGHYTATAGTVTFDGDDITNRAAHLIARAGIARTYQIPRPFADLDVLQNVALTAMFGRLTMSRIEAEREAWRCLAFTGLAARARSLPDQLNLHQRKFLEFARALAARPRLLLLDEVLSGLTPSEIDDAVAMIRRIRDQGTTVVFVEHVMRAVMALCDRLVVFDRGLLLAQGFPADVMQRPEVVAAYLGKPFAEPATDA